MEILTHILSFLIGAGVSWAISFTVYSYKLKLVNINNSTPNQSNNQVEQGSIVGRDQTNSH